MLPQSPVCAGFWLQAQLQIRHGALAPSERSTPFVGPLPAPLGASRVCCLIPWQVLVTLNGSFPAGVEILQNEDVKRRQTLSPASQRDGQVPLWAVVVCHFTTVSGSCTISYYGDTSSGLRSGRNGHRAGVLCRPAMFGESPACLHLRFGSRCKPRPWTECPLCITFITIWLASPLEGGAF